MTTTSSDSSNSSSGDHPEKKKIWIKKKVRLEPRSWRIFSHKKYYAGEAIKLSLFYARWDRELAVTFIRRGGGRIPEFSPA